MLDRRYKPSALIALILLTTTIHGSLTFNVPCNYWESMDLTGYKPFPNGSYVHKTTIIPKEFVSTYEYKIIDEISVTVNPYPRGCICKLIPCVRFCCPFNETYNTTHCVPVDGSTNQSMKMITTTNEGISKEEDISSKFFITHRGFQCEYAYFLDPYEYKDWNSSLHENGSVLLHSGNSYMGMHEYCLSPYYTNGSHHILPVLCDSTPVVDTNILNAYAMLVSVFFMMLTIAVYVCVPELRTLHGKSLCCYLLGLCVGYFILGYLILTPFETGLKCSISGYLAYFSFMGSFFWLTVMNFDIYYKMDRPRKVYNEKKSFRLYCAYSWGLAFICLLLAYFAETLTWIPDEYKPDIGVENCFLNTAKWSILIYLYGPLMLITVFNSVMFALTAKKIYRIKKDMSRIIIDNKMKPSRENIRNAFGIFVRLFIVMGVTWSMEILAYFFAEKWTSIMTLTNFLNGIQGLVIFCILVMKKRIWQHIITSFQKRGAFKGTFLEGKGNVVDTSKTLETISSSTRQVEMEDLKKEAEPLVLEG